MLRVSIKGNDLRRWATPLGIAIAIVILLLRRTDQLTDPQVWDEEGTQFIPSLLEHGARALFIPVNGYLTICPRAISYAALKLGGLAHYPSISTALGVTFTAAALAWIGTAPLAIRGGALLAIAVAMVPSDTEVFVVPLYTLWFAGLALFTLLLWTPGNHSWLFGRITVALVGGLSNPIVVLLAPLALLRAALIRTRDEVLVALSMLVPAGIQLWLLQTTLGESALPRLADAVLALSRFLGYPLVLWISYNPPDWVMYMVAAAHLLALGALLTPAESRLRRLALLALFFISAWSSMMRVHPPTAIHPVAAGPRYFFFPFVFLSWFWVDALVSVRTSAARLLPATAAALIAFSTSRCFNRHHEHLDWQASVQELAIHRRATFPIQFDGNAGRAWTVTLEMNGDRIRKAQ